MRKNMGKRTIKGLVLCLGLLTPSCETPEERFPTFTTFTYKGRVNLLPGESYHPCYTLISPRGEELYRVDWQHPSLSTCEKEHLKRASCKGRYDTTIKIDERGNVLSVSIEK